VPATGPLEKIRAAMVRRTTLPADVCRRLLVVVVLLGAGVAGAGGDLRSAVGGAPRWTRIGVEATRPPGRAQFGMAIDGTGSLYVYGGHGDAGFLDDFWRYDSAHGWKQLANPVVPPLVEPHLAADAAGDIFEFGGIGDHQQGPHLSPDGHSYGLYEYVPATGMWLDLTRGDAQPGLGWPQGREDHGFAYDRATGMFYLFAGEGQGNVNLDDMWRYDERAGNWVQIAQRGSGSGLPDAREIYNISTDGQGGIYLFGGAYLYDAQHRRVPWTYTNDLWRFDIGSATWHALAGTPNAYDPSMPMPRHYYGQACDGQGNFYILGGYVSDVKDPPYFSDDASQDYAQLEVFHTSDVPTGNLFFALADFWQYNAAQHRWIDRSGNLGDMQGKPFIPYAMVADPAGSRLITFGGYYPDGNDLLQTGAELRAYPLPAMGIASGGTPITATPRPAARVPGSAPFPTTTPLPGRR